MGRDDLVKDLSVCPAVYGEGWRLPTQAEFEAYATPIGFVGEWFATDAGGRVVVLDSRPGITLLSGTPQVVADQVRVNSSATKAYVLCLATDLDLREPEPLTETEIAAAIALLSPLEQPAGIALPATEVRLVRAVFRVCQAESTPADWASAVRQLGSRAQEIAPGGVSPETREKELTHALGRLEVAIDPSSLGFIGDVPDCEDLPADLACRMHGRSTGGRRLAP